MDTSKRIKSVSAVRELLFRTSNPDSGRPLPKGASEWVSELESLDKWDLAKADSCVRYLRDNEDARHSIFRVLDEERLLKLNAIDPESWEELIEYYCRWSEGSFDFEYCDILVGRLDAIFRNGSISSKARATVAMAKLGSNHNRWYVMRRLLSIAGSSCDALVAERVAIELIVHEARDHFRAAAEQIHKSVGDYHPLIAKAITAA